MSFLTCPQEPLVVRAVQAGALPEALRAHTAACLVCSAALRLSTLFATDRPVEATAEEASAAWRRGQAIADCANVARRPRATARLGLLDWLCRASLWVAAALSLAQIGSVAWAATGLGPAPEPTALVVAALLVAAIAAVGVSRQRSVSR
jgi:hypothetical protein